jgi:hypothetical protein
MVRPRKIVALGRRTIGFCGSEAFAGGHGRVVSVFQSIAVPPRLKRLVLFIATVVMPRSVGLRARLESIMVSLNSLRIRLRTCDKSDVVPPRV